MILYARLFGLSRGRPRLRLRMPFGGLKSSGVGHREQGVAAVEFFSEVITVYVDYTGAPRQQAKFI